jgi:hypothetical protein
MNTDKEPERLCEKELVTGTNDTDRKTFAWHLAKADMARCHANKQRIFHASHVWCAFTWRTSAFPGAHRLRVLVGHAS